MGKALTSVPGFLTHKAGQRPSTLCGDHRASAERGQQGARFKGCELTPPPPSPPTPLHSSPFLEPLGVLCSRWAAAPPRSLASRAPALMQQQPTQPPAPVLSLWHALRETQDHGGRGLSLRSWPFSRTWWLHPACPHLAPLYPSARVGFGGTALHCVTLCRLAGRPQVGAHPGPRVLPPRMAQVLPKAAPHLVSPHLSLVCTDRGGTPAAPKDSQDLPQFPECIWRYTHNGAFFGEKPSTPVVSLRIEKMALI